MDDLPQWSADREIGYDGGPPGIWELFITKSKVYQKSICWPIAYVLVNLYFYRLCLQHRGF